MKRILLILCFALLCLSTKAAPVHLDVKYVNPASLIAPAEGKLLCALEADNDVILFQTDNEGESWEKVQTIDNASKPVLWCGFAGRVWLFYRQNGALMMSIDNAPAREIARGYCCSAPVVMRNGLALLPLCADDGNRISVLMSMDRGNNWTLRPTGITLNEKVPTQNPDPILLSYKNGKLAMLLRGTGYQWRWISTSRNFGQSWEPLQKFIYTPDTPSAMTVLPSGRWMIVKNGRLDQELHYTPDRLIAYLSEDEGKTWYGDLLLDSRAGAYASCICAPGNGYIYIMYSYRPDDGSVCEAKLVKTSEMEINNAVSSRNALSSVNVAAMVADKCAKDFEAEVKPYLSTKGKPSGAPLNVASFNIEYRNSGQGAPWEERLVYVNEIFRAHDFDVVGVQEPFKPEYDDLCRTLGDRWDSIFACTDLEKPNFSNSIFYKKDKIELLDHGIFWYTEIPGKPRGFGGASSRLCIWAKLKDKTSGNIFFIFNSHFDFTSNEAMMTSSRLLASKVREIAGGYPVFCTGDYNSADSNPAMKYLAAGPFLNDSMTGAKKSVNPKMPSMGHYKSPDSQKQNSYHIDHIFYTPGLSRVDSWEILYEQHNGLWGGSDHNPINIQWQILK